MRHKEVRNSSPREGRIGPLVLLGGATMLALVAGGCATTDKPQDSAGQEQADQRGAVPAISRTVGDFVGGIVDNFKSPNASPSPHALPSPDSSPSHR